MVNPDWNLDPEAWIYNDQEYTRHAACQDPSEKHCVIRPRPQYNQDKWKYVDRILTQFCKDADLFGGNPTVSAESSLKAWIDWLKSNIQKGGGTIGSMKMYGWEMERALNLVEYLRVNKEMPPLTTKPVLTTNLLEDGLFPKYKKLDPYPMLKDGSSIMSTQRKSWNNVNLIGFHFEPRDNFEQEEVAYEKYYGGKGMDPFPFKPSYGQSSRVSFNYGFNKNEQAIKDGDDQPYTFEPQLPFEKKLGPYLDKYMKDYGLKPINFTPVLPKPKYDPYPWIDVSGTNRHGFYWGYFGISANLIIFKPRGHYIQDYDSYKQALNKDIIKKNLAPKTVSAQQVDDTDQLDPWSPGIMSQGTYITFDPGYENQVLVENKKTGQQAWVNLNNVNNVAVLNQINES